MNTLKNTVCLKLLASTLVEAIVAMLIVTIAFSMAFLTILNLSKNNNNSLKTKAYFVTNNIMVQTKLDKEFFDKEFTFNNFKVVRTVNEYEKNHELFQLNFSTYDFKNHKLFEQNELIIIETK